MSNGEDTRIIPIKVKTQEDCLLISLLLNIVATGEEKNET